MTISSESSPAVRVARVSAVLAAIVGLFGLLGYLIGVRRLAGAVAGVQAMAPGRAVMLVLAAASLWLVAPGPSPAGAAPRRLRRAAGRAAGAVVALYGAVLVGEHLAGLEMGVDRFLFPDRAVAWRAAVGVECLSPLAGLAFLAVGLTLAVLDSDVRPGLRPAVPLAVTAALISVVAFLANIFGLTDRTGEMGLTGMAPHTAVAFLVLSVGILACRPERAGVRPFTSAGLGGVTLRRLAPAVLLVVALLAAFLAAIGTTPPLLRGLRVTVAMTALLVLMYVGLLYTGAALDRVGQRQQALAGELRDHEHFSDTVLDALVEGVIALDEAGVVVRVNPRWSEITGYPAEAVVGSRPPFPWWPAELVAQRTAALDAALHTTCRGEYTTYIVRADGTRVNVMATASPICHPDGTVKIIIGTLRDMTEHDEAEAERRRLAGHRDHLFAMSQDLMWVAGLDGRLKCVNPAWQRTLGYAPGDLPGRPLADFVHPDDAGDLGGLAETLTGEGVTGVAYESRLRHRDGTYRWINWTAAPAPDDDAVYAVGRDVTAFRAANENRARLAAIVENTDEAIIGKTLDGIITCWNAAAERIYGYRAEEVVGKSVHLLIPPDQQAGHDDFLAHAARGEPVKNHDSVRIRKDGTVVHVDLSISPVRDNTGKVVAEASISREITGRRRTDERFRRLVVNAPVAMVMVDAEGLIRLVNKETERLFGYPASDLIGHPVELLVPHQLRHGHAVQRRGYLTAPVIRTMGAGLDLYGQRHDGTQFPVEIGLAPLETEEGRLVSAVIHDITERKQTQVALAAARDKAVEATKLRSQFVATVSHEIRTPMNGVIGLTNLLLDTDLSPGQRRYVDAIRVSGRALLTIINDILDFSKIEAGKAILADADFALDELVEEVVNVAAEASRDKHLEIIGYCPAGLPTAVRGDQGRLRQVLLNLIGNAVKFTERGEVVLRVEEATGEAGYTITVTDTGIGISPADVARLFDPFIQLDTASSRQYGGTGLGLTISRQLVELMGGRLQVVSRVGHGSRFTFTIPLARQSGAAASSRPAHGPLRGRSILLVDDSTTNLNLLAEHTRAWGMAVTTAPDAATALALQRDPRREPAGGFDIALLDQHMPGMGGLDLAEQLTAHPRPPVVVLLSSGHHDDQRLAATGGSLHLLSKPVGPSTLYNCLVQLLDPDVPARASERAAPVAPVEVPDHGLVLLAEDNEINQIVALDTLAALGYTADLARNGAEAVSLAGAKPYRAILMDCQMPTMDGFEATRRLRSTEPQGQHIPIIALTAGALTEDRQRCLDAGMDDYVAKPLDPEELRAALERWAAVR